MLAHSSDSFWDTFHWFLRLYINIYIFFPLNGCFFNILQIIININVILIASFQMYPLFTLPISSTSMVQFIYILYKCWDVMCKLDYISSSLKPKHHRNNICYSCSCSSSFEAYNKVVRCLIMWTIVLDIVDAKAIRHSSMEFTLLKQISTCFFKKWDVLSIMVMRSFLSITRILRSKQWTVFSFLYGVEITAFHKCFSPGWTNGKCKHVAWCFFLPFSPSSVL